MVDIVLYRHVLKYLCNKAIESIKLVEQCLLTNKTLCLFIVVLYNLYLCCFEFFEMI